MSRQPSVTVGGYELSKSMLLDLTKIRAPYSNIPVEQAYTGKKLENDWTLHLLSDDSRLGYDGALFSMDVGGQPHYVIYHQGANDIKDIPSIARLANGRVPQQAREAEVFTQKAMEWIAERHPEQQPPVLQVGYSLGGSLASLTSRPGQPVIAIDGPGCKKLLHRQGYDVAEAAQRSLQILSPHPNAINSHEAHIGNVLEAGEKFWNNGRGTIGDFIRMTVDTHHIRNIGLGLASMDSFAPIPAEQSSRPVEAFDSFRDYLNETVGEESSIGERALSTTANIMDKLWLDKVLTKVMVFGADTIAGNISKHLAEKGQEGQYRRPSSHPDVRGNQLQPLAPQQPSQSPEREADRAQDTAPQTGQEPAQKSHAAAIQAKRGQAAATGHSR